MDINQEKSLAAPKFFPLAWLPVRLFVYSNLKSEYMKVIYKCTVSVIHFCCVIAKPIWLRTLENVNWPAYQLHDNGCRCVTCHTYEHLAIKCVDANENRCYICCTLTTAQFLPYFTNEAWRKLLTQCRWYSSSNLALTAVIPSHTHPIGQNDPYIAATLVDLEQFFVPKAKGRFIDASKNSMLLLMKP